MAVYVVILNPISKHIYLYVNVSHKFCVSPLQFFSQIQFYTYANCVRNEPFFIVLLGILQPILGGGIFLHTLVHMFSVDLSFI